MVTVKYLLIFFIPASAVLCLTEDNLKQKEIEELEKEKSDLLKQIHTAIDDSVTLLKKENTTQNEQGVNYMLQLKQQLQYINDTNKENTETMEENSTSELENRRKMRNSNRRFTNSKYKTTLGREFDINPVLFGKKISAEKIKQLMQSRILMQKKLDDWILQRELEKAKIRERYLSSQRLIQAGLLEKCPRFGFRKKKKRISRRAYHNHRNDTCVSNESESSIERRLTRQYKKRDRKYPCCRKCCKKSYMGCL